MPLLRNCAALPSDEGCRRRRGVLFTSRQPEHHLLHLHVSVNAIRLPSDFHQHGLLEYESLNLLQLTSNIQQAQYHYTLRVAIMYRKWHHWDLIGFTYMANSR